MKHLLLLAVVLLFTPTMNALRCHIGEESQSMQGDGFQFCLSSWNPIDRVIRYDGRFGDVRLFGENPDGPPGKMKCFQDTTLVTGRLNCVCFKDGCNHKVSQMEFRRMFAAHLVVV